jgi:hypothetical protein
MTAGSCADAAANEGAMICDYSERRVPQATPQGAAHGPVPGRGRDGYIR